MSKIEIQPIRFDEIDKTPEIAGIYAWYYRIEISDRDIDLCIDSVEKSNQDDKLVIVENFCKHKLFNFFLESPYHVTMKGKLKPKFAGALEHENEVSKSLIMRIASEPQRLKEIKKALLKCAPHFASPIYLGVAKNLRSRLLRHKFLIELFQNAQVSIFPDAVADDNHSEEDHRDHSFANEVVCQRKLNSSYLLAYVLPLSIERDICTDVENILNRIYYPLCGRN